MLTVLRHRLRRHRTWVAATLAVLALAVTAIGAHSLAMSAGMDHQLGDAVAVCLLLAGGALAAGVAVAAVRRLERRPCWSIPEPATAARPSARPSPGFLVRAGPPGPLVLRL
ncbi:MAG: hypothetical protein HZB46_03670 [Solirubrobacterales bacterium]|nr:hypothetical protein [Solirubrobacterales bacterium]